MVKYSERSLDLVFGALSDPTRRAILLRLRLGEATVTELAEPFRISLPAVSKHLRMLEKAGLIHRSREGRMHRCRLRATPMQPALAWLEEYRFFWEGSLDRLAKHLDSPNTGKKGT